MYSLISLTSHILQLFLSQVRNRAGDTGGAMPPPSPSLPLFYVAKRKKGDKGKKERVSRQKLLKGCHRSQNIIVLAILERLEFENFSCRPTIYLL